MGDEPLDRASELAYLPVAAPPTNHGHTLAAWVTVVLVLLGSVISALGVMDGQPWIFWAGLGVVLVGVVAGRVLKMLGFGQKGPDHRGERPHAPRAGG